MLVNLKRVKKEHGLFKRVGKGLYTSQDLLIDEWYLREYYGYSVENSMQKILPHLKELGLLSYGVADTIEQVKEYYTALETSPEKFIVIMMPVYRKNESFSDKFRFERWGKYIGKHVIRTENFYEQEDLDVIYSFRVLMVNASGHRPARREHIHRVKTLLAQS